jgi:hypothetical protein
MSIITISNKLIILNLMESGNRRSPLQAEEKGVSSLNTNSNLKAAAYRFLGSDA